MVHFLAAFGLEDEKISDIVIFFLLHRIRLRYNKYNKAGNKGNSRENE